MKPVPGKFYKNTRFPDVLYVGVLGFHDDELMPQLVVFKPFGRKHKVPAHERVSMCSPEYSYGDPKEQWVELPATDLAEIYAKAGLIDPYKGS